MARHFVCESGAAPSTDIARRSLLTGLAGLALASGVGRARAATAPRISQLVDDDWAATDLARSLAGREVTLRGYFAPALRAGVSFDLYERPAAPCQLCGSIHDAGASLPVEGAAAPKDASMMKALDVTGRLAIDEKGMARLVASSVAAV